MDIESTRHSLNISAYNELDIWRTIETLTLTGEELEIKIESLSLEICDLRRQTNPWTSSDNAESQKLSQAETALLQVELLEKEKKLREFRSTIEAARALIYFYRNGSDDYNLHGC